MNGLLEAFSFLTCVGGARVPTRRATTWFPVVGLAVGAALGGLWWLLGRAWPWGVAAALVVVADLIITGLLHFDGLVDTADGLIPPMERQRRLEVMRDPRAGAFGVVAAGATLLVRWVALASIAPSPLLLAGIWCASRSAMAVTLATAPYARSEGLATEFVSGERRAWSGGTVWTGLAGIAAGAVVASLQLRPGGAVGVVTAMVGFFAVVLLAQRRLGGFTGDVLGAAGVLAETLALVVASAQW